MSTTTLLQFGSNERQKYVAFIVTDIKEGRLDTRNRLRDYLASKYNVKADALTESLITDARRIAQKELAISSLSFADAEAHIERCLAPEQTETQPTEQPQTDVADSGKTITQPASPVEGALMMAARGVAQVRLVPRNKFPISESEDWQNDTTNTKLTTNPDIIGAHNGNFGSGAIAKIGKPCFFEIDTNDVLDRIKTETGHELINETDFHVRSRSKRGHIYLLHTEKSVAAGNISQTYVQHQDWSFRADGQFVVSVGSLHPISGKAYELLNGGEIRPVPDWLVDWMLTQKTSGQNSKDETLRNAQGLVPHGSLHGFLVKRAGMMRAAGLEVDKIEENLLDVAHEECENPIDEEKVKQYAQSMGKYAKGTPWAEIVLNQKPTNLQFQLPTTAPTAPPTQTAPIIPVTTITVIEDVKEKIPPFDSSVLTGFFKKFVETVCEGTTIPPQFVYLATRVYAGAYMSTTLKLSGVDCDTCVYGVNIGETGTSKGLSWRRGVENMANRFKTLESVGIINSADSGAGLRDAFFALKKPIIMFIDELKSLGNKANTTKNPEIVDMIIELADTKNVGRTKAKNGRQGGTKSTEARLGFYGCAQSGEVFREAFVGRGKQGVDERFDFEYSEPIEAGALPDIPVGVLATLQDAFVKLASPAQWKEPMVMASDAETYLQNYWNNLPVETRQRVRFLKSLRRDIYLQAWSRGVAVAELDDVECVVRHFSRQLVIRRVLLGDDAPNKVGLYISRLKELESKMHERCNKGIAVKTTAKTLRDFQTETYAYKENELDTFRKAWDSYCKAHLTPVQVKGANGCTYTKYAPMPHENETWLWEGVAVVDWRNA